jgi:hypothetical protein
MKLYLNFECQLYSQAYLCRSLECVRVRDSNLRSLKSTQNCNRNPQTSLWLRYTEISQSRVDLQQLYCMQRLCIHPPTQPHTHLHTRTGFILPQYVVAETHFMACLHHRVIITVIVRCYIIFSPYDGEPNSSYRTSRLTHRTPAIPYLSILLH